MYKKLSLLFSFLLFTMAANAQFTTIFGSVVDTDGTAWTGGTISVQFLPNPSQPNIGQYRVNGAPLDPSVLQQGPIKLGGAGAIPSTSVYNNTDITPVGSQWQFTVCPNASSSCGISSTSVSGANQDISSVVNAAIKAPRFNAIAGTYGYIDGEAISTLPVGATYWNVTSNCQRYNNGTSWACPTGGSGCSVSGAANQIVINSGVPGCNSAMAEADSSGNIFNGNVFTAKIGQYTNISGEHFVDGTNAWTNSYGTGNTITVAYADVCINGGYVQISQFYSGTEAIPVSCASLSIGSPVQAFPLVVQGKLGQQTFNGVLSAVQFGADGTGTTDTTASLTAMWAAAFTGMNYVNNIGNPAPIYFSQGIYTNHEFQTGSTHGSPCFEGAPGTDSARIYYGGAGGSGSYLWALPILAFGCLENLQLNGVNAGYHTSVTTMAQNGVVVNQASAPEIDAGFKFSHLSFADFYGNAFQLGSPTLSSSITNGFFDHFRTDGVGGYALAFYNENVASGSPIDIGDFTTVNQMNGLIAAYCIAQGYCNGSGSTVNTYGNGTLFISKGRGQIYNVHDGRMEVDQKPNTIGNFDQGQIFSNDDDGSGGPVVISKNVSEAGNIGEVSPYLSTAAGDVHMVLDGYNSFSAISSLYKNRLTQQEYGDQFKGAGVFYSLGLSPVQFQGFGLEGWTFDVIPKANYATNAVPRSNSDWLVLRGTDFVPGASGPLNIVVSPTAGGQASLQATQVAASGGTLSANSTFNTSGLNIITAGTGGSISGVGNCTLTGFNNGLTGAIAVVTFVSSGSWTGATFTVLEQGTGATTITGLSGTLVSGNPVDSMNVPWGPVGPSATCSGTATLTATITTPAGGSPTYANVTGFAPGYPSSHIGIHLGANLTILSSGSGGSGSTQVTVVCVDNTGAYCAGVGATGLVVTPAPACLSTSSCPAGGSVVSDFTQATTSNYALEANRTNSSSLDGTSCPYKGDYTWFNSPAAGSLLGYGCGADFLWHKMGIYGATQTLAASLTTTSATADNVTVTGMTASGHCSLQATNASAASNVATTYISNKTTNQITVTHATTSGMLYDVLCTNF